MGGPYLHQQALMDAYKKLYMLGNHAYHPQKVTLGDDIAEGVGAIRDRVGRDKRNREETSRNAAALRTIQEYGGANPGGVGGSMRGGGADMATLAVDGPEAYEDRLSRREVARGDRLPAGPDYNPYKEALSAVDKNEMANHARIGGHYTFGGLKNTMKNADDMGHDMAYGKMLYGLGGSMPPQTVTTPPPDYMQGYRIPQ